MISLDIRPQDFEVKGNTTALPLAKQVLVGLDRKVTDADVEGDELLTEAAVQYITNYEGDFDFMVSLRDEAWMYGFKRFGAGKLRGALNCLRAEALREVRPVDPALQIVGNAHVHNGTYTVVLNGDDDYVTLRIKSHWDEQAAERGEQVVQYLSGEDNESSYTGFAFLSGANARVWKKFGEAKRLRAALDVLLAGDLGEMGHRYAIESGRCFNCGRKLTVPVSLHRGLGPECAKKWGHQAP